MANPHLIAQEIHKSVEQFNKGIPKVQQSILEEIELLLKEIDIKNGNIIANAKNVSLIAKIKKQIERLILNNHSYNRQLEKYLTSFTLITQLQNKYFEELSAEYKPPKLLKQIRQEAISSTYDSLTKAGISSSISEPIRDILRVNITSGAPYAKMLKTVRNFLTTNEKGVGTLERYASVITKNALNQYSAQFSDLVTNDLGLKWGEYVGSLTENSRDLCIALHKKRYIHVSELSDIVKGDFKEFKEIHGKINPKTGLPYGMIDGTNATNFKIYRGGHGCEHQFVPVNELAVPAAIRLMV